MMMTASISSEPARLSSDGECPLQLRRQEQRACLCLRNNHANLLPFATGTRTLFASFATWLWRTMVLLKLLSERRKGTDRLNPVNCRAPRTRLCICLTVMNRWCTGSR
jgi:hypothetical protein